MKKIIPFLSIFMCCCTQNQTLKEKQAALSNGHIDNSYHYSCKEVGWETELPQNWNVFTRDESAALNNKGKNAIEKSTGIKVDVSSLKELVNLKKDKYSFLSTIEPFDSATDGDYDEHNTYLNKMLSDTYTKQKIKMESSAGSEILDGKRFATWEGKIFAPGSDNIILWQKMYSRLINGYDFSMTMSYNNESDKAVLMKIISSSVFSKFSK